MGAGRRSVLEREGWTYEKVYPGDAFVHAEREWPSGFAACVHDDFYPGDEEGPSLRITYPRGGEMAVATMYFPRTTENMAEQLMEIAEEIAALWDEEGAPDAESGRDAGNTRHRVKRRVDR